MIDDVFSAQHALVTRRQAGLASLTDRQIGRLLAQGTWVPVYPGVYRHAAAPETEEQRVLAAVLACGPGAVLSHRSAAIAQGTRTFSGTLVEVSVPHRRGPEPKGVIVHRVRDLHDCWIHHVRGIPVTVPARTIIDVAAVAPVLVERLVEEWLADRKVAVAEVRLALDALGRSGRRGPARVRRVLEARALGDLAGDSTDEHLIATVLALYGAPTPVHHHLVRDGGDVVAELDYAFVEARLGLELLGVTVHTRPGVFRRDLDRLNRLQRLGWLILQYTPDQVRARPWAVAREIDETRRFRSSDPSSAA